MYKLPMRLKAHILCNDFGFSVRKTATQLGVSKSSVQRWKMLDVDDLERPVIRRRRERTMSRRVRDVVDSLLEKNHFLTAFDIKTHIEGHMGMRPSLSTIARCRKRAGFRFKLSHRCQQHQRADPDHPFFRSDLSDAIAVDEASFVSSDRPRRGWGRGNSRVPRHPPKRRKRISLLLAIDRDGVVAMCHKAGAFNSATFADFLYSLPCGRKVVLDNVSFHKSRVVRDVANERDMALTFTPPYCPWFNPVEFAFSVSKAAYRHARLMQREDFIGDAVQAVRTHVTGAKCRNFFDHAAENVRRELAYTER